MPLAVGWRYSRVEGLHGLFLDHDGPQVGEGVKAELAVVRAGPTVTHPAKRQRVHWQHKVHPSFIYC